MALMFTRAKRVSDPLNERAKARLLLGTTHHDSNGDPSFFPNLIIHDFFDLNDDDDELFQRNANTDSTTPDSDQATNDANCTAAAAAAAVQALQDLLDPSSDPFRLCLHSDVIRVADTFSDVSSTDKYMQSVMAQLRELRYNAGICKTKWESSSGLVAGSYEYIDVVVGKEEERYIVDLEFKAQFEVARATEEYEKVVGAVPRVVVGRKAEVRRAVKVVAEAVKRSMKRRGMSVPPWRKKRYLLSKWFGHYRRSVHCNNSSPSLPTCVCNGGENIKCCSVVGFW